MNEPADAMATILMLRAELAEANRRRDHWRVKAEGYDALAAPPDAESWGIVNKNPTSVTLPDGTVLRDGESAVVFSDGKWQHGLNAGTDEAAEALLGAAYRAALENAANKLQSFADQLWPDGNRTGLADSIRALPIPADLAARLGEKS